jgi:hypothetical protein
MCMRLWMTSMPSPAFSVLNLLNAVKARKPKVFARCVHAILDVKHAEPGCSCTSCTSRSSWFALRLFLFSCGLALAVVASVVRSTKHVQSGLLDVDVACRLRGPWQVALLEFVLHRACCALVCAAWVLLEFIKPSGRRPCRTSQKRSRLVQQRMRHITAQA